MYADPHQSERAQRAHAAEVSGPVGVERGRGAVLNRQALYVISVVARLVEMHPTTLRKYEREGLLEPSRTPGRTRLYSPEDIRRLQQIKWLVTARYLNLAGVQMALEVTDLLKKMEHVLETAPDAETLRRGLEEPLREANAALGVNTSR